MSKKDVFRPFINNKPYEGLRKKDWLICYHRPDGEYFRVSQSAERIIGYSSKELLGANQFDYYHPDDREFIRKRAHEVALSEGLSDSVVYRFRHKDGHYVVLETLISVLRDSSGNAEIISTMTWRYNRNEQ